MPLFSNMAHCMLSAISPRSIYLKMLDEICKKSLCLMVDLMGKSGKSLKVRIRKKILLV